MAQTKTAISDSGCRDAVKIAFDGIKLVDPSNLTAHSFVLRLDTTESLNGKNTTYISALKMYDDLNPTSELLKTEITLYQGTNLIQRTVADGKRVWSYDPYQNSYSVDAYNTELGANAPNYRPNYFNFLKATVAGSPQSLVTLMEQSSLKGTAWVKDWLGGISFAGVNYIPNDMLAQHQFDTIWQKVPDNSRFVQFNLETFDGGMTWILNSIQIHKEDKVGASVKVSDSYLTIPKDPTTGLPLTETRTSPDFIFVPPTRSKVLASPRTVKF